MRRIERGYPPDSLTVMLDLEPDRRWDSSGIANVIEDIRVRLLSVQNGLCAYCERPLSPQATRIEHIHPRSVPPCDKRPSSNHHYEWGNLVAVCWGNGTCDEPKDNLDLCADIYFPDTIYPTGVFTVDTLSGSLSPNPALCEADAAMARRTIDALRLDDIDLREKRRAALYEAQRRLIAEGEPPALVRWEMLREGLGFPTTIEFVCAQLA